MEADTSTKFSPSKLGVYKGCPRQYRYRYVDRIKRDAQSVEAFVGSCVHAAFEALYESLLHGKTPSLEETLRVFEKGWEKGWSDKVVIRDAQFSPEDWRKVGQDCVLAYYEAKKPFDQDKTVAVERRMGFPLEAAGEECRIEGFIDRLALAPDGAFEIHDYKTGRTLPAQAGLDADWQLPIYEIAVRHAWPDTKTVRLVWHYVRHGKTLASSRRPEELEALKGEIAGLIETIRQDHEFVPRKSPLCDWCDYRDICPLWSHVEKVSRMAPERLGRDEGVKLVDQLAEIDGKKRELRDQLREIERDQKAVEAALMRFAEAEGITVVAGREGEAAVTEKEEYRFPTKTHSPEALEALERELKASPIWREVSHLDTHRLIEGFRRREWDPPVLGLVESLVNRYAKLVREKVLRLRRKREAEEE